MRTLVDIGDAEIGALDALAQRQGQSRAAVIRRAVDDFLARNRLGDAGEAFGLWGAEGLDGVAYQRNLRDEW